MFFPVFAPLFLYVVIDLVQSVPFSDELRNAYTHRCLTSVNFKPEAVPFLLEYYTANCREGAKSSVMCEFASKNKDASLQNSIVRPKHDGAYGISIDDGNKTAYLNVYNLFTSHPVINILRCIEPQFDSDAFYHTSITYDDTEYYYGFGGISQVSDGKSSFGAIRKQIPLGLLDLSSEEMELHVKAIGDLAKYTRENYRLFTYNCNTFSNKISLVLFDVPIDPTYQQSVTKLADTPLGHWINVYQSYLNFD